MLHIAIFFSFFSLFPTDRRWGASAGYYDVTDETKVRVETTTGLTQTMRKGVCAMGKRGRVYRTVKYIYSESTCARQRVIVVIVLL